MADKKIYKYPLPVSGETVIEMPEGAVVLCAQNQHDTLQVWALVDPTRPAKPFRFQVCRHRAPGPGDPGTLHRYGAAAQRESCLARLHRVGRRRWLR